MELALFVAVVAALAGLLRGGSLERLANTHFRASALLIAGIGIQVLFSFWSPEWMTDDFGLGALVLSNLLVLAFILVNRTLPGVLIAGMGLVLNLLVISANGAMPVSEDAAHAAGAERLEISEEALKHVRLDDDTQLGFLGDVIPVPWPGMVLSIGDIVLAAGIAVLAYVQTRSGPKPVSAASD